MTLLRTPLLAAAALAVTTAAQAQDDPVTVGFVYVGPVNDGGWSQHHHESAMEMAEHFGDSVEIVEQESVPEGADAERVMTQMALSGADIIFATSFGYQDPVINVAERFPEVRFEHATGYRTAENVATYSARFYEGRAVTGYLAGEMTETDEIGYIGSFPIPEVIRGINSSFLAARAVNPEVEMNVVWLYTWFDPAQEADATQALIDQGADVVLAHTDSTAPLSRLEDAGEGYYGFGQASDMMEYAPAPRISSIIDDWTPYYIDRVQAVMDGDWETGQTWSGIGGLVQIGAFTDAIPEDIQTRAAEIRDAIEAGEMHPFTGPINRQDGSQWLAEGETADDATLLGMDFYVEGLTGQIPN